MECIVMLIMSNGIETVDIIGTEKYVSLFEGAFKVKVNNIESMWKQIYIAKRFLLKQGFEQINEKIVQYECA